VLADRVRCRRHPRSVAQCATPRLNATTTKFDPSKSGARATTVEPTMQAGADFTDSDYQLRVRGDRDSCANLTAVSTIVCTPGAEGVYENAPRPFRHPKALRVADILEASLALARCVIHGSRRRNALS
jgi:hypothetical protein